MTYRRFFVVAVAFSLFFQALNASAAVRYSVTDIGTFGGDYSSAADINNNGQVVGEAKNSDGLSRAFLYQNGAMTNLGTVDEFEESAALAISPNGNITGTFRHRLVDGLDFFDSRAFLYSDDTISNIGAPPRSGGELGTNSNGFGINSDGIIVGQTSGPIDVYIPDDNGSDGNEGVIINNRTANKALPMTSDHTTSHLSSWMPEQVLRSFSQPYSINSTTSIVGCSGAAYRGILYPPISALYGLFMHPDSTINDPDGGTLAGAFDINEAGQIAGIYSTNIETRAFLFDNGTITDLGVLSTTVAIEFEHAFLYDNGVMTDLGTLGDFDCQSVANDINDLGLIVGESTYDVSSSDLHAFLYEDGTMVDLNDLIDPASGWTLVSASAVNDNGWIVGYGVNADGETHAFLLTPVPEPTAAAMALIAAAGLILAAWNRNRRAG